jgi:hypothetical protein
MSTSDDNNAMTLQKQRRFAVSAKVLFGESPLAGVDRTPQDSTREWIGWMPMAQGL